MPEETIQWDKLTAEEKNKLVAQKVMNWLPSPCMDEHEVLYDSGDMYCRNCGVSDHINSFDHGEPLPPRYTQGMSAAWRVLQKMAQLSSDDFEECWQKHELLAFLGAQNCFDSRTGELLVTVDLLATWTPEMVCIAALKAVGCTFAKDE